MKFERYWEERGHLGGDPEEVALLAWDAATSTSAEQIQRLKDALSEIGSTREGKSLNWPEIDAIVRAALGVNE